MTRFDPKAFLEFVRSKPAEEVYPAWDGCGCALYQFLTAQGVAVKEAGFFTYDDGDGQIHEALPQAVGKMIRFEPYTWGSLASRLEKVIQ